MPDIFFKCGKCGKHLVVDDAGAGLQVNCPECNSSVLVPVGQSVGSEAPATSRKSESTEVGQTKTCPKCGTQVERAAAFCMKCGFNLTAGQSNPQQEQLDQTKQSPTIVHRSEPQRTEGQRDYLEAINKCAEGQHNGWGSGIFLVLVVIGFIIAYAIGHSEPNVLIFIAAVALGFGIGWILKLRSWIASVLVSGGLVGATYFFFLFDTSVKVPEPNVFGIDRVNNIGLLADRQNGIVFCFGVAVVGGVIEYVVRSRK